MKSIKEYPASNLSAPIEAKFIRKIELFRDNEIRLVLRDGVVAHPISHTDMARYSYTPKAMVRVAHSDDALVVMFEVEESHLRGMAKSGSDNVWEDSCVGIAIEEPETKSCFNFYSNCIGTLCASHKTPTTESTPLPEEKASMIRISCSLAQISINSRGEGQTWWLMMIIPFSILELPRAPKLLHCNFYKRGEKCDRPHCLSWTSAESLGEILMA